MIPDPALVADSLYQFDVMVGESRIPDDSNLLRIVETARWFVSVFTTCPLCGGVGEYMAHTSECVGQQLDVIEGDGHVGCKVFTCSTPDGCGGVGVVPTDRLRNAWREWAERGDLELKHFVAAVSTED